ncbi:hypothetical protein [Sutterella sp.]|uniref:hypothetical protein n=1 Tax=Sutterella sp. TaxID=1981025 RepID=UPI0026DFA62E|nr:hypothetical protein [Sutterella sp.]MDO5530763.1 hypothetical protein [Sutterella sp.]
MKSGQIFFTDDTAAARAGTPRPTDDGTETDIVRGSIFVKPGRPRKASQEISSDGSTLTGQDAETREIVEDAEASN